MKTLMILAVMAATLGAQTRVRVASNMTAGQTHGSYLGVAVVEVDAERAKALKLKEERGVEVRVVEDGSPAAKAGLKEGDVVLEYNGQRIEGLAQFIRMVSETPVGRKASMQVTRAGALMTVTPVIESRPGNRVVVDVPLPPMPPMPSIEIFRNEIARGESRSYRIGIETESLGKQLAEYFGVKEGVLVRSVTAKSVAERAGFKAGDVIVKLNGDEVRSAGQITAAVMRRKALSFGIMRNHREMNLDVKPEEE